MKKCVLVVEDDPLLRMDVVDIVESAGFETIEAASADEAILKLEAHPAIAHLLTDIEMPGSMNGMDLAFVVRDRWPPIAIVVMSGRVKPDAGDLPDRVRFIAKPYRPAQIQEALRQAA